MQIIYQLFWINLKNYGELQKQQHSQASFTFVKVILSSALFPQKKDFTLLCNPG